MQRDAVDAVSGATASRSESITHSYTLAENDCELDALSRQCRIHYAEAAVDTVTTVL
jgi:hypothetical protein